MKERKLKLNRFFLFWGLSGIFEIPFIIAFFNYPGFLINHLEISLALHAIATLLLFFTEPRGKGWWDQTRLWSRNSMFLTAFFSLFGWVAAGFLFWSHQRKPFQTTATVEEEMNFGAAPIHTLSLSKGNRQERVLKSLDFMPISEIMAGDDNHLKRGAIERLTEFKTPEAIELLQSYRSDATVDIRFYVTTALTRIKNDFEEQLRAAKETLNKDKYKLASRVYLARTYLQYAESHLLDVATASSFIDEALYHLHFSILDENAPADVFSLLTQIYRRKKDWKKILQVVDVLEKRNKVPVSEVVEARTEAYYYLERYPELLKSFNQGIQAGSLSPKLGALANWWTG